MPPTEPIAGDRDARLLLHELVQQSFGDLVTMRRLDDLRQRPAATPRPNGTVFTFAPAPGGVVLS